MEFKPFLTLEKYQFFFYIDEQKIFRMSQDFQELKNLLNFLNSKLLEFSKFGIF